MTGYQMQLDIFNRPTLNIGKAFKTALANDASNSKLYRKQIVERMNDLADRNGVCLAHGNSDRLTLDSLDKWLAADDMTRLMPLKALPIFCAVTGQSSAISVMAQPLGLRIIGVREQKMLAWAEAKMTVKEQNRMIRKIEEDL